MTDRPKLIECPRDAWPGHFCADTFIAPAHSRQALIWALEAAALNADLREFRTGVLKT